MTAAPAPEPAAPLTVPARRWTLALALVLLVAAAVRLANFPHRYEVRDMDETGYADGGLVLWEGITPGIRVAPAALQTWEGWAYAAVRTTAALARPDPALAALPAPVRPFMAIDRVLFDAYQDLSGLRRGMLAASLLIGVAGVYGAFRLGEAYGGTWGGVLAGGLAAVLPLHVEFAAMSRPYSDAWAFALLALYAAAVLRGRRRWIQTGICLALAVGSRIDMLGILPLVAWLFWDNPDPAGRTWRSAAKAVALGGVLATASAPWLVMSPVGILRTIATTRSAPLAVPAGNPRLETLRGVLLDQGLGPAVVAGCVLMLALPGPRWGRRWALAAIVGGLAATMFAGPYVPLRYHGAPVIALLVLVAVGGGAAARRWRGSGLALPVALAVVLALPAVQVVRQVVDRRRAYVADDATAWVERHVPAGTTVYEQLVWDLRPPLPTPAAADAAWAQLTDGQAWRRKFERGLARYNLGHAALPRALSEDNLVLDRGLWRRYFILGGDGQPGRPRYDLRPFGMGSQVFGEQALPQRLAAEGGVVVWRELSPPPPELGVPTVAWTNGAGVGTFVYCSPDVRAKLKG